MYVSPPGALALNLDNEPGTRHASNRGGCILLFRRAYPVTERQHQNAQSTSISDTDRRVHISRKTVAPSAWDIRGAAEPPAMDLSPLPEKCRKYRASGLLVKQFSNGNGQQRNGDEHDQPNYDVAFDLHRAPPLRSTAGSKRG